MKKMGKSPKARTVLGPVDAGSLGITLPHEHIFADARTGERNRGSDIPSQTGF